MPVHTLEDALAVYYEAAGDQANIPAGSAEYDTELGGWLLENTNGPLAFVRDDGTIVDPVRDADGEWVIPAQS